MTTQQRGRPTGSVAPTHRVRRDYRFSQEALDHIAKGRELESSAPNETAFVEQTLAHYTAFLEGSVQSQEQVNQEVARLQTQVRDLERDLASTQKTLRLAEAKMKPQPQPVSPAHSITHKPLYQLFIRHDPGACPALPDGYNFLYTHENDQQCPVVIAPNVRRKMSMDNQCVEHWAQIFLR